MLTILVGLIALGMLAVLTASAPMAQVLQHDSLYYFERQGVGLIIGTVCLLIAGHIHWERWRPYLPAALMLSALLLVATYLPGLGRKANGASRWLSLGFLTFQPSELAKLVLVLYVADYLAKGWQCPWPLRQRLSVFLPIGGILGLILLQPDLGTTVVVAMTVFALYFAAGTRLHQLGLWGLAASAGVLFLSWHTPYQRHRLLAYLDPWADAQGIGYHLVQSLLALGSGGIWGLGLGQGRQKLFYLPAQHTDFIYAVVGEEMGLVGAIGLLLLFLLLAQRCLRIAGQAEDPFAKLITIGIVVLICGQALLNIGVVTASIPTTGVPLPLISYGGTSLVINLTAVGLVLAIARWGRSDVGRRTSDVNPVTGSGSVTAPLGFGRRQAPLGFGRRQAHPTQPL